MEKPRFINTEHLPPRTDAEAPELSQENQEAVKELLEIENLTEQSKALVLLVLLDLKPASLISASEGKLDPDKMHSIIKKMGLLYTTKNHTTRRGISVTDYFVARNQENLDALLSAHESEGDERDVKFGQAVGIPQTAIDAFVENTAFRASEIPSEYQGEFELAAFVPSKAHFNEELETVRRQNAALKSIAPELFK